MLRPHGVILRYSEGSSRQWTRGVGVPYQDNLDVRLSRGAALRSTALGTRGKDPPPKAAKNRRNAASFAAAQLAAAPAPSPSPDQRFQTRFGYVFSLCEPSALSLADLSPPNFFSSIILILRCTRSRSTTQYQLTTKATAIVTSIIKIPNLRCPSAARYSK